MQGQRLPCTEVKKLAHQVLNQAKMHVRDAMDTDTISLIEFVLYIERSPSVSTWALAAASSRNS